MKNTSSVWAHFLTYNIKEPRWMIFKLAPRVLNLKFVSAEIFYNPICQQCSALFLLVLKVPNNTTFNAQHCAN